MQPPRHIGPYELVRPLGVGGMAETFLALRRGPAGFKQRVCLKRILPAYTAEPRFVELFLDEARLLAHMHSASIVQVFDFGEAEGTYYMALELVDGTDLEGLLRSCARTNTRLPIAVSLYVAAQLLSALDYAHTLTDGGSALHIVHRDISPSNVLLSKHGEVKLTDFGIAKSRQRTHKTKPGHTKGKLAYMCPEQVRGDPLDARSDLFSVGVVLYEMLAGAHPFTADSELSLVDNILRAQRPNLRALVPEVSLEAKQLVDRLLAADADARPLSAREALKLVPLKEQPFLVQRKLAELVSAHCGELPVALAPAAAASDAGGSAPVTAPLRAAPQRAQDAPRIAPMAAAQERAPTPRKRRARWGLLLVSALGAIAGSLLLALPPWSAGPQPQQLQRARGSAPPIDTKPARLEAGHEPAALRELDVAPARTAELPAPDVARPAETRASTDAVLPAPDVAQQATLPVEPAPHDAGSHKSHRKRRLPRAADNQAPTHAGAAEPEPPRHIGRSGMSVRADEF